MESDFVFRVLVGILLFSFVIHRGIQTRRRSPQLEQVDRVLKTNSGHGAINLFEHQRPHVLGYLHSFP